MEEIEKGRNITHEYIAHLVEVQETRNSVYLIYEAIRGKSIIDEGHKPQNLIDILIILKKMLVLCHDLETNQDSVLLQLSPSNLKYKYNKELCRVNRPILTELTSLIKIPMSDEEFKSVFRKVREFQIKEISDNGGVFCGPEISLITEKDNLIQYITPKLSVYSLGVISSMLIAEFYNINVIKKNENINFEFNNPFSKCLSQNEENDNFLTFEELTILKELRNLIEMMTKSDPKERIDLKECLNHIVFQNLKEEEKESFFDYLFDLDEEELETRKLKEVEVEVKSLGF